MILAHLDAAHWWGPVGWVYRNTPGNLAASAMCVAGAWLWKGRKILDHLDELHRHHGIGKYREPGS